MQKLSVPTNHSILKLGNQSKHKFLKSRKTTLSSLLTKVALIPLYYPGRRKLQVLSTPTYSKASTVKCIWTHIRLSPNSASINLPGVRRISVYYVQIAHRWGSIISSPTCYPPNYRVAVCQAHPHEWKDTEYLLRRERILSRIKEHFSYIRQKWSRSS